MYKKKIIAAGAAIAIVVVCGCIVFVNNNKTTDTMNSGSSSEIMSEISSDVNSNESKDESSESIIIGTAPDDEGGKETGNGNVIDFPDDDKSSSKEEASSSSKEENSESKTENSTSKEETSSSTKEPNSSSKEETSTSKEPTTTPTQTPTTKPTVPDNSSSSSNVVVVPPVEDDPIPTPTPNPTPTPSTPSGWNGNYDSPLSDGFDHIKIPTRNDFYSEGLTNNDGAFDFNGSDWSNAWWDAYQDFLVANGSPVDENGNVYGAFYAIHDGFDNGHQYLYYGYSGGEENGWGDIALYNNGMHPTIKNDSNYNGSYILELTNFTFGNMDKQVENDYRAATTMLLSWIVPNPSQVEKEIYEAFTTNTSKIENHLTQNGFGSWMQIGDIDICVSLIDSKEETYVFAIREHR